MTSDLTGQRVLVTAAAQGIGRATARAFDRAGARVLATDINAPGLAGLDGCETARLDVLDAECVAEVCARAGAVDVLFNAAGVVHSGTVLDCSEAELDFAYDLNVKSMVRMVQAVLPGMLERKSGTILNVSSVASSVQGVPNRFVYSTTKAAVLGLTKAIAFVARQPMGRIAAPEEIADLAVYLAGATFTTGQACCIDGGWTL